MATALIPPPPPGFELEGAAPDVPPPPPGFELEAGAPAPDVPPPPPGFELEAAVPFPTAPRALGVADALPPPDAPVTAGVVAGPPGAPPGSDPAAAIAAARYGAAAPAMAGPTGLPPLPERIPGPPPVRTPAELAEDAAIDATLDAVSPETARDRAGLDTLYMAKHLGGPRGENIEDFLRWTRDPRMVLEAFRRGIPKLSEDEFRKLIAALERGQLAPDEAVETLGPVLTPAGRRAVEEAAASGRVMRSVRPDIVELPGGLRAFMNALVRGLTGRMVDPRDAGGLAPPSVAPGSEADIALRGSRRALQLRQEQAEAEHPILSFAAEAAGSVVPFAEGVQLLRSYRLARGLPAVERSAAGFVKEGAKVGGPQAFAYRPEGAEEMTAGEELQARLVQTGIGLAAGALLDFGAAKVGEFASRYLQRMRDARFARALEEEARARGFKDTDTYVRALIDIEATPDGLVVRPRKELLDTLPGATDTPSEAVVRGPAPEGASAPPEPAPAALPPPPPPDRVAREGELAELERLAGLTEHPAARATLQRRAEILRTELAGERPQLTPEEKREARRRASLERIARARVLNPKTDDLITAIRKLGGIDTEIETDWAGRLSHLPRRTFGLPAVERPGRGRTLDDLAEALWERGYLERRDVGELYNKLDSAAAGEELYSFDADLERVAGDPSPRPRSTDRDWVWTDEAEARGASGDFVLTDEGALVPTREMSLEDWHNLEREMQDAERWLTSEGADAGIEPPRDAGGGVGDRPPERMGDPVSGRAPEPRSGETGELPGVEPRNVTRQGLHERALEVDERLRGREDVPPDAGPGDLFSGRARQTDIEDFGDGFKLREPEPDGVRSDTAGAPPTRRREAAVPQGEGDQLQLFLDEGAAPAAHAQALRTFGPRVAHVQTGTFPAGLTRVARPADVAHVVAPLRREAQESVLAVVTDDAGQVLRIARISKGGINSAPIDPGLVAGSAASTPGARRVWFAHNHPSGAVDQSQADLKLTRHLHQLLEGSGIEPQGMIVVGPGGRHTYYAPDDLPMGRPSEGQDFSVQNVDRTGEEAQPIRPAARRERLPVTERRLVRMRTPPAARIESPTDMADWFRKEAPSGEGLVLLDNRHRPVGFLPMTSAEMRQLRQGGPNSPARRLFAAFDETNATAFAARTDLEFKSPEFTALAGNLDGFAKMHGSNLLDVLDRGMRSAANENGIPTQSTFYANPFTVALRETARDLGLHPVRNLGAGFAGGTYAATTSEAEVGSAQWWLDVAAGAAAGVTLAQFLRRTQIVGKGSIVDNWRARLGDVIESLPLIGRGPEDLRELKRKQRLMRQLVNRQTEETGRALLKQFTPAERGMMADLIETRGIVPDLNLIHRQAQILDDYLVHAGSRLKELGMLPADLELGGYLHRYYAKHLGLDKAFREAKYQTLTGSYSIARGTDQTFARDFFSPGARAVVDELEKIQKQLAKLERRTGDLLTGDTVERIADLKARKRELAKVELREFVGIQNGRPRSFLFTRDEVGRVESDFIDVDAKGGRIEPTLVDQVRPTKPGEVGRPQAPGSVRQLHPTNYVWSARAVDKQEVLLHRDWTKFERESWGEIKDAGYRYVRGMAEVSHDLSLATMFKAIADNAAWAKREPVTGRGGRPWVFVPDTKVGKGSPLKKYGALAGMYVRPDVWAGIKNYGRPAFGYGPIATLYRDALQKWKLYKTVYNPVTHWNNSYSNVEMLHMAGYSSRDLAGGLKHMIQGEKSALWREARDAGLFGTDWTTSLLKQSEGGGSAVLEKLAEALRTQPEIPDAALATSIVMDLKEWFITSKNAIAQADSAWSSGAELAKAMGAPVLKGVRFTFKPVGAAARAMQRAYKFEDELFKMAVFAAERRAGKTPEQAVEAAEAFFFDYNDVPEAVKIARDFPIGSPFVSYTYFAIQAIARNIAQNPERVLFLAAGYEAMHYAALVQDGLAPGEYWQVESAEEEVSPPWEKGRAVWGARNTVRLPFLDGYRLALGRAHALGNPFMDEAGGRQVLPEAPGPLKLWGSSVFGSNPLHAVLDTAVNEDWKGKPIYKPGAPAEEKAKAIAAYLYQAWAPSNVAIPGGYQQARLLEGLANQVREDRAAGGGLIAPVVDAANGVSEALGFGQFTGKDRADNEILTRDALLASFGIKLRPIRFEQSVEIESSRVEQAKKQLGQWYQEKVRLHAEGRLTAAQMDRYEAALDRVLEELEAKRDTKFDAEEFLEKRLPR